MQNIFMTYEVEDVLIILFAVVACIYGLIRALDWFQTKSKEWDKKAHSKATIEDIEIIKENDRQQDEKISLLLESDRARIKGEILKQYQYFKRKGTIDTYSYNYLCQIYDIYKTEGGNSFAEEIMDKIADIPFE